MWKIDRFARSTSDHYALRAQLMKYGVNLYSVTEPISDDPIGKMTEAMLAGYAQFENDIRKQRCEGGMQRLIVQGIRPWQPPIGYMNSKTRQDKRKTEPDVPDPERFHLVQRGLKEFAKGGLTLSRLNERYREWGLKTRTDKPMRKQLVDRILKDKFYAGILVDPWSDNEYIGQHEPMITLEEWEKAQYYKKNNSNAHGVVHRKMNPDFPLRVFVQCTCKIGLTGAWRSGRNKKYAYYNCRNKDCSYFDKSIPKLDLEQQFIRTLQDVTPNKKFLKLFEAVVIDAWKNNHTTIKQQRQGYEAKLKRLEDKLERIKEMREEGEYTSEEFKQRKEKTEN